MSKLKNMVGKIFPTNNGGDCIVVEYINAKKVVVKFLGDFPCEVTVEAGALRKGEVKNPCFPSLCGVGFVGMGIYKTTHKGKPLEVYKRWKGMTERCYGKKTKANCYSSCSVSKEWHNFQNFAEWYTKQEFQGEGYHLDKDLLKKGNKVYSEENCCLIPSVINSLLVSPSYNGDYPQGVTYHKRTKRFAARVQRNGRNFHVGHYSTPEEAFVEYKVAKEKHVKNVAAEWEGLISSKVYKALMNWTVE